MKQTDDQKLITVSQAVREFEEFLRIRAEYGEADAELVRKNRDSWIEGFRLRLLK